MQDRREVNQSRIADIARSIEDLSTELNRCLQIEGEYIVVDTLNNLIEAEITLPTTEPLVETRAVPVDFNIQNQAATTSTREVHENLQENSTYSRVNLPTEVSHQVVEGEAREPIIRPIRPIEVETTSEFNELQVEQPNARAVEDYEVEATERTVQLIVEQQPTGRPIESNGVGNLAGSNEEEEFRVGDLVVITNRYLNLRGRKGTIKKVLPKFLELELEFSSRRIKRKKGNVRLIQRQI